MKIFKFITSILFFLGIIALMIWAVFKTHDRTCNAISIIIHSAEKHVLLTKSDISNILEKNNLKWEGKAIKEMDLFLFNKILAQENYIKSVDKVHFLGSKLQIEITLYDILLEVHSKTGEKYLLDMNGVYLPYSPKVGSSVIVAERVNPYNFKKKEAVSSKHSELYQLFTVASLIKSDCFYADLFHKLYIDDKQNIILVPSKGEIPVVFGNAQEAETKLKTLRYMYDEVLPYMSEHKYARLDVRFKNRIVATKSKS